MRGIANNKQQQRDHTMNTNSSDTARRVATGLLLWFLMGTMVPATMAQATDQTACNPAPAKGDLILPMPGNLTMVLRPVHIGTGATPFALRRIALGGDTTNFKEYPVKTAVGGSFIGQRNGKADWLYYIGKYEISRDQYDAVMHAGEQKRSTSGRDGSLPVVNLTMEEVQRFLGKYNQWLFDNALDKLPSYANTPSFLRLPTEAEWEFAARGGCEVDANTYDQPAPYKGDLALYEWFSDPGSSRGALHPIGQLQPNILGIHDMLGNAMEMTASLYQVEYYQGRVGGLVVRGGSYNKSRKEMRSTYRNEKPLYVKRTNPDRIEAFHGSDVSFRVVLSSQVFPPYPEMKIVEEAWAPYRAGPGREMPAGASTADDDTKEKASKNDALEHVRRLKEALRRATGVDETVSRELHIVESTLQDIDAQRREANLRQAYGWLQTANNRAFDIFRESRHLRQAREWASIANDSMIAASDDAERQGFAKRLGQYRQRVQEIVQSIDTCLEQYTDAQRQLVHFQPAIVDEAARQGREHLAKNKEQLAVFDITRGHLAALRKIGRVDAAAWRKDLDAVAK